MAIRGPGRPWHEKLRKREKRTILVGVRITPADAERLDTVLAGLADEEKATASTYVYGALLRALDRDERRLARRTR